MRTARQIADDVSIAQSIETGKHIFKHFEIEDKDAVNLILQSINDARLEMAVEITEKFGLDKQQMLDYLKQVK